MRSVALGSVVVLALALVLPGCGSCGSGTGGTAASDAAATSFPPVPTPDGLVAQGWVRAPDALWARVQNGVSGAVALLPPDVGSLVCAAVGLDARVAPLVDGKGTSYFVAADAGAAGLTWAAALPLKDVQEARTVLLGGDGSAAYTARAEDGMQVLARAGKPLDAAAALAGKGWLVVAQDDAALARLGPYAWRTMPTLPPPDSPAAVVAQVPGAALAGPLASHARERWAESRRWLEEADREQRERHGGRAPDFGDPRAIIASLDALVQRRIAFVSQGRGARVEADAGENDLHVDVRLTPGPAEAGADLVAAMRPGDERPMGALPADTLFAMLSRSDAPMRAEDAADAKAAVVGALGDKASPDDRKAFERTIDDWTAARGDWMTAAIAWGADRGLMLRTPSSSAGPAVMREWIDLTRRPVLADPLRSLFQVRAPTVTTASVPDVTDATLAAFAPPKGPALGIAWGMHDGELLVAAGEHAPKLLGNAATPPARLGDDLRVSAALAALGSDASFTVVAEPLRLDATRAASARPAGAENEAAAALVFGWGRRGGDAWARVDVADELLRELVRMKAGL
ncbi:MAG TPA: hypothetical protein VF765_28550 [Polyangiaceae bacterium]